MTTAIDILSQIFDKDEVKYVRQNQNLKINSNACNITIKKHENAIGYSVTTDCAISDDPIIKTLGKADLVETFNVVRTTKNTLFVYGTSNDEAKAAGEAGFYTRIKTKYPHHQALLIRCKDDNCIPEKGGYYYKWED